MGTSKTSIMVNTAVTTEPRQGWTSGNEQGYNYNDYVNSNRCNAYINKAFGQNYDSSKVSEELFGNEHGYKQGSHFQWDEFSGLNPTGTCKQKFGSIGRVMNDYS